MNHPLTAADATVVIPARNAATTLGETIDAIARQDGGAPTVVVVDDGSTDDTAEVAARLGTAVIRTDGRGPGAARNRGIEMVTTAIVAFCDADDVWSPDRLRQDLNAFDGDPDLDVLVGRTLFEADDPALLTPYRFERDDRSAAIPHFGAATMRTGVFRRVGAIDESLANYEDYEWFFRARDLGARTLTHDRIVQTRRMHAGSTSQRNPPRPADLLAVMQRSVLRRRSSPPARAFWFLPEFPPNPGGIGTYAASVAPALARLGHDMHLLVGWNGPSREVIDGVDLIREPLRLAFDQSSPTGIMRHRRRVAELKSEIRPTLYHVHLTDPTPVLHLNTSTTAPAPTILTLHNELVPRLGTDEPDSLFDRLLRTSQIVTGVSATVARQVASALPAIAHRVVTIPNGVVVDPATPPLPDRPHVLALGRLMPQKGFDRVIRAMPTVIDRFPDAHLDIVGDGPERSRLEALIRDLGLHQRVTLHGHVDRDLVPGFFARAQVVVAPSDHEGLPYALLEAAAHGRPIIGSRIGGIEDVVVDGDTGRLLDHTVIDDDPAVLGREINAVLDDPDLARRWGSAGRVRVERFFSVDVCAAAYDHVYRALGSPLVDVAVIIPAHNAARHLPDAIESALASTERLDVSIQLLVVDDGSTDGTAEVAAGFTARGVQVFRQPNLGTAMARNAGIALTNSRYIAHLDADDLWPAGRLAALLAPLEANPDLEATFGCGVEFADADAPASARWNPDPFSTRMATVGLVRRSAHDRFGGFVIADGNDQLSWAAAALGEGLRYGTIDDVVLRRRIHAGNKSHKRPFTADRSRVAIVKAALDARRRAAQDAATGSEPPTQR
jgi:glycosyltransferase involved in cell wall biosynthesis